MESIKLYDARNLGEYEEGKDLTLKIECIDEDGSEYKGWYYTVGTHYSGKKCNFFKTRSKKLFRVAQIKNINFTKSASLRWGFFYLFYI